MACAGALATIKYKINKNIPTTCKKKGDIILYGLKELKTLKNSLNTHPF